MWVSNHQIVTALICIKSYMNECSIGSNFATLIHSHQSFTFFEVIIYESTLYTIYQLWLYLCSFSLILDTCTGKIPINPSEFWYPSYFSWSIISRSSLTFSLSPFILMLICLMNNSSFILFLNTSTVFILDLMNTLFTNPSSICCLK